MNRRVASSAALRSRRRSQETKRAATVSDPALIVAVGGYFNAKLNADLAAKGHALDVMKYNVGVYDRVQGVYVALIQAERERHYNSTHPEHVRQWLESVFRPCASAVYLAGSERVRSCLDSLIDSYGREAVGEPVDIAARLQARHEMISAMRAHLEYGPSHPEAGVFASAS
jgi:hypothetical protein